MKEYGDYKYTSVSMNKDLNLINSLAKLASKNTIEYIIETGTHNELIENNSEYALLHKLQFDEEV